MTAAEWIMLAVGLFLLMASGAYHLGGILLIRRITPQVRERPILGVLLTFWALVVLHSSEIAIAAAVYAAVLAVPGAGSIAEGYGDSAGGLLFFSGTNYSTLGYTQQIARGPIRLLAMLQALGGFMLLTWSATFVYSIWADQFGRRDAEDDPQR
jgi:hypothetical protein